MSHDPVLTATCPTASCKQLFDLFYFSQTFELPVQITGVNIKPGSWVPCHPLFWTLIGAVSPSEMGSLSCLRGVRALCMRAQMRRCCLPRESVCRGIGSFPQLLFLRSPPLCNELTANPSSLKGGRTSLVKCVLFIWRSL